MEKHSFEVSRCNSQNQTLPIERAVWLICVTRSAGDYILPSGHDRRLKCFRIMDLAIIVFRITEGTVRVVAYIRTCVSFGLTSLAYWYVSVSDMHHF